MANYLYNGIELPALPEWDRESYPYAVILQEVTYSLVYAFSKQHHKTFENYDGTFWLAIDNGETYLSTRYEYGAYSAWEENTNTAANNSAIRLGDPAWSNYDILNPDGSVYLAASNPVPVYPENEEGEKLIVIHELDMDLIAHGIVPVIQATQGDTARAIALHLFNRGTPWELPDGTTAVVSYYKESTKTSGNYTNLENGDPAVQIGGNVMLVLFNDYVCSTPGITRLSVGLFSGGTEIHTFTVTLNVQPNPGLVGNIPEPEPSVYEQLLESYIHANQQRPLFANTIKECIDTTKVYVLPDGYIYAYMMGESAYPAIVIGEPAPGYRHSDGHWEDLNESYKFYSNYTNDIPVTPGDQFTYKGHGTGDQNPSVVWLDSAKSLLSYESYAAKNAAVTVTAPENAAYVWFQSNSKYNGTNTGLEVAWVYCQAASEPKWQNTGHQFVPADYEDRVISLESFKEDTLEVLSGVEETQKTVENHDVIIKNHATNLLDLSKEMVELQEENLPQRTATLEQTVQNLSADTIAVFKPVEFAWTSETAFAQGSVGGAVSTPEANSDYGYAKLAVIPGESYAIKGRHSWSSFCYAVTDDTGIILQMDDGSDASDLVIETEFTVMTGGAYLYINRFGFKSLSKQTLISTVMADPLMGKTIVYEGDSIAESRLGSAYNGGGYAKVIADLTFGNYVNHAVSGGILRSAAAIGSGSHSVVDNLPNLPTDADLYCFEGGINDWWGTATLGSYSLTDFTGTLDTTTVCGALETIFRYCLTNFPGKPVCFVITHKVQSTAYNKNGAGNTFKDYRDAMVAICQKYSIPYYDAFSESGLNGWNSTQDALYLTANANGTPDGCHPNEEGYKRYYVPQLLALFRRIMPVE